jgi:AraC-like DNA-binding protein
MAGGGFLMLVRAHVPCMPLGAYVEDFWLYEGYAGDHLRECILPSGTVEMVFNLQEDELRIYDPSDIDRCRRLSGALVSGPYAGSFISDTAEEANIMGVHFKPGGVAHVLGMPTDELANAHVDLEALWGPGAARLRQQLCDLREPDERFHLLENVLLKRMADRPSASHGAVRMGLDVLARTHGRTRVRDIAKAVDLGQRRFSELFAREVGLTPKLFGRVQRFQHAISLLRPATEVEWAQFAIACGYFDQSHLIHEFVEFSGLTPSAYLLRQTQLHRASMHVKRFHLPLLG